MLGSSLAELESKGTIGNPILVFPQLIIEEKYAQGFDPTHEWMRHASYHIGPFTAAASLRRQDRPRWRRPYKTTSTVRWLGNLSSHPRMPRGIKIVLVDGRSVGIE